MPKTRTIEWEMLKSPVEIFVFECETCHTQGGHKKRYVAYCRKDYNDDGDPCIYYGVDAEWKEDPWGEKYIWLCHGCKGFFCQNCAVDTSYDIEQGIELNSYGGFFCKSCMPNAKKGSGQVLSGYERLKR